MEHGVIKFVDSDGFTRRLMVRKKSEDPPAISFSELAQYVRRVFELQESTEIRIKYKKDGDEVVVEEEMGWQETCYSLSNREVLAVDVQIKLPDTKKVVWQQITIAPRSSPVSGSPHFVSSSPSFSASSSPAFASFAWSSPSFYASSSSAFFASSSPAFASFASSSPALFASRSPAFASSSPAFSWSSFGLPQK